MFKYPPKTYPGRCNLWITLLTPHGMSYCPRFWPYNWLQRREEGGVAKRSHTWGEGIYTHSQTSHIFAFMLHCHSRETFHCANIKTEKKIKQCGQFYDSTWEERRQIVVTDISEVKEEIFVKDESNKLINWTLNRTKIKTALLCWNSRLKWKCCVKILLKSLSTSASSVHSSISSTNIACRTLICMAMPWRQLAGIRGEQWRKLQIERHPGKTLLAGNYGRFWN